MIWGFEDLSADRQVWQFGNGSSFKDVISS
jgi:hypothetical protein